MVSLQVLKTDNGQLGDPSRPAPPYPLGSFGPFLGGGGGGGGSRVFCSLAPLLAVWGVLTRPNGKWVLAVQCP